MLRMFLQLHLSSENGHFLESVGLEEVSEKRPPGAGKASNPQFSTFLQCLEYLELSDGPDTSPGWSTHEYYRLREFQDHPTSFSWKISPF